MTRYAFCKVCGKRIAERKDGSLRAHGPRHVEGRKRIVGISGTYTDGTRQKNCDLFVSVPQR